MAIIEVTEKGMNIEKTVIPGGIGMTIDDIQSHLRFLDRRRLVAAEEDLHLHIDVRDDLYRQGGDRRSHTLTTSAAEVHSHPNNECAHHLLTEDGQGPLSQSATGATV